MKIRVDEKIHIEQPTPAIAKWCRDNLVLDNPDYYKKERMGKWTGGTPREIFLYEKVGDELRLPFGCLQDIWRLCVRGVSWSVQISPIRHVNYRSSISLYPYQEKAVTEAIRGKNGILVMPCGSGKGLPIDAKICTPTGWKRNGDLQIGDAVVGSDGKATRVTGIFDRGKVDAYKITFSDGVQTVCDKDHLWTVQKQSQRAESGNWDVMNAQAIYEHYQNMKCRSQYLYIPIVDPVEFYGYEDYRNMNPWLLGFLLGDGCFQKTMISMSTNEDDIRKKVVDIIGKDYGACEWIVHKKNYDWRFCGGYTLHDIRSLGLECKHSYEKFIPKEYLFAPVEVRLAVLQGLFDADGHINNGCTFEYCTTSKQLADDVVFIVESLGGTAKVKEKIPKYTYAREKRTGRKAYRIFFKLYQFKPFTSKKHSAVYRERTHYNKAYRIIKKIEPCEPITSRCITVDAEDQLYVTEHFVVTHNTQCGLEIISRIGGRALWLTHTQELLNQSKKRAESVLECPAGAFGTITAGKVNIGTHITFATVQTLSKLDLSAYRDQWDVIIVDECMPGETLIDTPTGKKELKNLRIDDIITSYNGNTGRLENKRITHIFKSKAHDIVKVKLSNGEEIICTGNHPIFTRNRQWIDAERLVHDDYVLRLVRQGSRNGCNAEVYEKQSLKERVLLLFQRMFSKRRSQKGCVDGGAPQNSIGNDEKNKQEISRSVCGKDENKQSIQYARSPRKNIKKIERNRTSSKNQMWQRHGADGSSTNSNDCACKNCGSVCRISNTNKNDKRFWLSDLLQSGYSNSRKNDCNRSGRKFSLFDRTAGTGSEKRALFDWVRVESVEVQEPTSDGTFGGLCADGYVYNIEVEDNNNYFADGILVHNCQHAAGSPTKVTQFYRVISQVSARFKIGLTATPKRADGLERSMFALLGPKLHEVTRAEVADTTCPIKVSVISTGWIPDYNEVLMGDGTIDYSKVIDNMIHDEERYSIVFGDILSMCKGPTMILANRVEYLERICEDLGGCGKRAMCLSGKGQSKRAKEERKRALEMLNTGELDFILCTYQLAAEGLDVPNLRYVVFVTPEKDPTRVQQATGRVGRKADGKDCGVVIDFVDAFGLYKSWQKKREAVYKKLKYDII